MRRLVGLLALGVALLALAAAVVGWRAGGAHPPEDLAAVGTRTLGVELRSLTVPVNGIRLHVIDAGLRSGQPVVLLHGFPEFWWAWRRQIAPLVIAGFRVIVPDQRGYDLSDKPADVAAYRVDTLVADVVGLLDMYQAKRVFLAGHDWGGAIAWRVAIDHPERVRKLVMFNSPHPLAWDDLAAAGGGDAGIGWYRTFFQLPWLPETLLRATNWRPLARSLRDSSRPGTFDDVEIERYRAAWARDGAMRAMIDWYRAVGRFPSRPSGDGRVTVPTRIVWGMRDAYFDPRMAALSAAHCTDAQVVELPDAGHWLLHEEPEPTSRALVEFFGTR